MSITAKIIPRHQEHFFSAMPITAKMIELRKGFHLKTQKYIRIIRIKRKVTHKGQNKGQGLKKARKSPQTLQFKDFSLAEKERTSCRFAASHLQNIVALLPPGRNSPCFVTRFCSLHRHLGALATLPLLPASRRSRSNPSTSKKQGNPIGLPCFFGGEGEI